MVRVEDNSYVLIEGTVIYQGVISIASTVTFTTTLYDSVPNVSFTGSVVSIRGHRSEDDQWDIVVSCENMDASGQYSLPLHYHFDNDDTTATIA